MNLLPQTKQDSFLLSAAFFSGTAIFIFISRMLNIINSNPFQNPNLSILFQEIPIALFTMSLTFLVYGLIKTDAREITFTHTHAKRFLSLVALIPSVLLLLYIIIVNVFRSI